MDKKHSNRPKYYEQNNKSIDIDCPNENLSEKKYPNIPDEEEILKQEILNIPLSFPGSSVILYQLVDSYNFTSKDLSYIITVGLTGPEIEDFFIKFCQLNYYNFINMLHCFINDNYTKQQIDNFLKPFYAEWEEKQKSQKTNKIT